VANFVFNIAKGRVAELGNRVNSNDPTNSVFLVIVNDAGGDSDATMLDRDTVSALFGGTSDEVTNSNYARKSITSITVTTDDTNDRQDVTIADQTWTAVGAGDSWTDIVMAYDSDSTGGDDTNVVPMTNHDFAVTPDGSDITADFPADAFFRAS
jgi:hypothetical protein